MCDLCEPVSRPAELRPIAPDIDLTACSMFDLVRLFEFFETLGDAALGCLSQPRFGSGQVSDFTYDFWQLTILRWKEIARNEIERRTPTSKADAEHRAEVLIRDYSLDGEWLAILKLAGSMVVEHAC